MNKIETSLGYLLNTGARLIKRELDEQLGEHGITTSQWAVLKLLDAADHVSQAYIAERLNADRATCGAVIEKLIKKNLLIKELSAEDHRSYLVEITLEGRRIAGAVSEIADKVNAKALENISNRDAEIFGCCLEKIIRNLGGEAGELES